MGILAVDPNESDDYQLDYYALWEEVEAFEAAGAEVVVVYPAGFPEPDWGCSSRATCVREVDDYLPQVDAEFTTLAEIAAFNEENPGLIPYGQERFYVAAECPLSREEIAELGHRPGVVGSLYGRTLCGE